MFFSFSCLLWTSHISSILQTFFSFIQTTCTYFSYCHTGTFLFINILIIKLTFLSFIIILNITLLMINNYIAKNIKDGPSHDKKENDWYRVAKSKYFTTVANCSSNFRDKRVTWPLDITWHRHARNKLAILEICWSTGAMANSKISTFRT